MSTQDKAERRKARAKVRKMKGGKRPFESEAITGTMIEFEGKEYGLTLKGLEAYLAMKAGQE